MARKLRLEYPGAIYHVINRGNYRAWVFKNDSAKAAFEACLFAACQRCGWILHAYIVMGNHYHLAIETPQGNLSAGMHWLQATFANRFNRLRGEHGHLFQGRYKSLLVEPGEALGQVCHYIHLNPVRAGIVSVSELKQYRYSSYWHLWSRPRPGCLQLETALAEAGGLADTPKGHKAYADYLAWQAEEGPLGKTKAYASLSRGWALGSRSFKESLLKDHDLATEARAWEGEGAKEVRRLRWRQALEKTLPRLPSRTEPKKSAAWKLAIAAYLKATTDVTNQWLAEALDMGSGFYVSKHVGLMKKSSGHPALALLARLNKVKGKT